MGIFSDIYNLFASFFSFANLMITSIVEGLDFVISFFSTIPIFINNNVLVGLPGIFKSGLYGVICVMLFTIVIKIFSHIKL